MFHVEPFYANFCSDFLIIVSIEAVGSSLRTAFTALVTFAFVKPSIIKAVVASTPETPISRRNIFLSSLVANP